MDKANQPPTISMQVVKLEDGTFGVSLIVAGLSSKSQAEAAMAHMERQLCGQEIRAN